MCICCPFHPILFLLCCIGFTYRTPKPLEQKYDDLLLYATDLEAARLGIGQLLRRVT